MIFNLNFENRQNNDEKIVSLAKKISNHLHQDSLEKSTEMIIAEELITILKTVPKEDQERLLELYTNEAIKNYDSPLPSVTEQVQVAVNIARQYLENPHKI